MASSISGEGSSIPRNSTLAFWRFVSWLQGVLASVQPPSPWSSFPLWCSLWVVESQMFSQRPPHRRQEHFLCSFLLSPAALTFECWPWSRQPVIPFGVPGSPSLCCAARCLQSPGGAHYFSFVLFSTLMQRARVPCETPWGHKPVGFLTVFCIKRTLQELQRWLSS